MILKYQDIKQRRSRFIYDILTDASRDTLNKILQNDPDLITIQVKINGEEVPVTVLEKMYKDLDDVIDYRAKHKAIKIIEQLTPTFQDRIKDSVDDLEQEMKRDIINYSEEIQFTGEIK